MSVYPLHGRMDPTIPRHLVCETCSATFQIDEGETARAGEIRAVVAGWTFKRKSRGTGKGYKWRHWCPTCSVSTKCICGDCPVHGENRRMPT